MWEKLKHAFAVDSAEGTEPTDQQLALVDRLCEVILSRGMKPAAVAFLEMSRPLNYIGAQGMHFLEPIATTIFSKAQYKELSSFMERRDAVDIICDRLDSLEGGKKDADSLASTINENKSDKES